MKSAKLSPLVITPTLLTLLQSVTSNELDQALQSAFPQYFVIDKKKKLEEDLAFLQEFQDMELAEPKFDVVEYIREMRNENHLY